MDKGGNETNKRICHPGSNTLAGSDNQVLQHPLANPLILDNLFSHCSFRTLAWCRLVCRDWLQASTSAWRACASLTVAKLGRGCRYVGNPKATNRYITLPDFMQQANDNKFQWKTKPFRSLIFQNIAFGLEIQIVAGTQQRPLHGLLDLLGDTLTSMELHNCKEWTVKEMWQFIFGDHLPNLRSLRLLNPAIREYDVELAGEISHGQPTYYKREQLKSLSIELTKSTSYFPLLWLELLSHCPALDSFKYVRAKINSSDFYLLLNAIQFARQYGDHWLPLQTFNIQGVLHLEFPNYEHGAEINQIRELLRELKLSLSCLNLTMDGDTGGGQNVLDELLNLNRITLQEIKIVSSFPPLPPAKFKPHLGLEFANLAEIELSDGLCPTMGFLKVTPHLRKLKILNTLNHWVDDESGIVSNSTKDAMAHVRLVKLTLLKLELMVSKEDIRRLIRWMPNVDILGIYLDDSQFSTVCKHWGNLKKLEAFGKTLTDRGVTGEGGWTSLQETNEGTGGSSSDIILPNITFLKELQCFHSGSRYLTDASVYNGFLKLPKLRHINFDSDLRSLEFGGVARNALTRNGVRLSAMSESCKSCVNEKL